MIWRVEETTAQALAHRSDTRQIHRRTSQHAPSQASAWPHAPVTKRQQFDTGRQCTHCHCVNIQTIRLIGRSEIFHSCSEQPLQAALADLVTLNEITQLGASSPLLDQLAQSLFTQTISDPPRHDRLRLGPQADFWILKRALATLAEPPPGAFQQVSPVSMVGVSPNKVHQSRRSSGI